MVNRKPINERAVEIAAVNFRKFIRYQFDSVKRDTRLRLDKQIYNRIRRLAGIDLGTKCKLSTVCGLARGNPQWPGVLDLFRKPKISQFTF